MKTISDPLLSALIKLKEDGPVDLDAGICTNVKHLSHLYVCFDCIDLVERVCGGSYPLGDPAMGHWKGEKGIGRRALLDQLIEARKAELAVPA